MEVPFCIDTIGGVEQIQSVQPGFRIVDDRALGLMNGVVYVILNMLAKVWYVHGDAHRGVTVNNVLTNSRCIE